MVEKVDKELEKAEYLDFCSLSDEEIRKLASGTEQDRAAACSTAKDVTHDEILAPAKMGILEEVATMIFLAFGVPNGVFTIPIVTFLIGKFLIGNVSMAFAVLGALLLPLIILPQPFVPSILQSWLAVRVIKYFSFRFIFEDRPPPKNPQDPNYRPRIMVAPPHGVFPYGNILAMIVWPAVTGSTFRGLAASSALRPPIFKQILRSIGIIDASRHIARKAVEDGESLGISTGGVAEVFETNEGDECIVLKQRIGLIKLAIRTGADLVPCYLFGNTDLLSCWAGEGIPQGRTILEKISRKIGFALIIIHGRFGLPIPRRVPVLGVMGKPIPTYKIKCEEPTQEQIETIQKLLLDEMQEIFERYKGLYGWKDKKLIIK
jgi:1-acyl-sn-glycerol-3-phosphate acyltransferase